MSTESHDQRGADPRLVRVEKGEASPEELAAITALLMVRAAQRPTKDGHPAGPVRSAAPWRRLERVRAYRPPHSWQG